MTGRITLTHVFLITLAFAVALLVTAHPAFAQANGSAGSFSCTDGHASGSLYSSGLSCPTTMGFDNIFSFVVCNMEQLSSNLMGNMFCGMIASLTPAVSAVLVLATVFFGIAFTIGMVPATAREFQMFLIKVSFVWAFATQSDYLIGIGYAFFINGIRDGIAIALTNAQSALDPTAAAAPPSGSAVYAQLDGVIASFMHYATDYLGVNPKDPINPADPNAGCKNALFAVMAIMAVAFPPVFYLCLALIGKLAMTFLRAIYGYIYALVGIAFLMTLAPFFLSFFLFRQTRPFFDKWIGYLASFALQIIILFAFLSFVLSINVNSVTGSLTSLIIRAQETKETSSFRAPWDYCTLCIFQQVDMSGTPVVNSQAQNFLGTGKLQCIKFNEDVNQDGHIDAGGEPKPIGPMTAVTPNDTMTAAQKAQATAAQQALAKTKSSLLTFMSAGLLSLVILAYVVDGLLVYVASLAQTLASGLGGYSAPQLGGGRNASGRPTMSIPFEGNINDFSEGFERGFNQRDAEGNRRNSITSVTTAFKYGASNLVQGRDYSKDADHEKNAPQGQGGIANRLAAWFIDPTKMRDN